MCIKETSQGDVSFTHTKHVFDRKKNLIIIHFLEVIYSHVYLPIIRTFDTSKQVAQWATIPHLGASTMFGDTIIDDSELEKVTRN